MAVKSADTEDSGTATAAVADARDAGSNRLKVYTGPPQPHMPKYFARRKSSLANTVSSDSGDADSLKAKSVRFDSEELHDVCLYDSDEPTSAVSNSPRFSLWDTAIAQTPRGTAPVGVLPRVGKTSSSSSYCERFQPLLLNKAETRPASVQPYITDLPYQTFFVNGNFPLEHCCCRAVGKEPWQLKVGLERFEMTRCGKVLEGSILVANVAFEKKITVRWSYNGWKSSSTVNARFKRQRDTLVDEFVFTIAIDSALEELQDTVSVQRLKESAYGEANNVSMHISMAIRFQHPGQLGAFAEFWDNNDGKNYNLELARQYSRPLPSSVFDFFDWRALVGDAGDSLDKLEDKAGSPSVTSSLKLLQRGIHPEHLSSPATTIDTDRHEAKRAAIKQAIEYLKYPSHQSQETDWETLSIKSQAHWARSFSDSLLHKRVTHNNDNIFLTKPFNPLQFGSVSGLKWEGFLSGYRNVPESTANATKSHSSATTNAACAV